MFTKDKITYGGEIKSAGEFKNDGKPFYVMLVPKSETASTSAVLKATLIDSTQEIEFPFVANIWNPVSVKSLNVVSGDLTNYRIFYGGE